MTDLDGEPAAPDGPEAEPSEAAPAPAPRPPVPTSSILLGLAALLLVCTTIGLVVTVGLGGDTVAVQFASDNGSTTDPSSNTVNRNGNPATQPSRPTSVTPSAGAAHLDFAATAESLQPAAGGAWTPVTGQWGQTGGQAAIVVPGGLRSLAVLHLPKAPRLVQVTLSHMVPNAGLVVSYQDRSHYVMVVPVPSAKAVWVSWVNGNPVRPDLLLAVPHSLADGMVVGAEVTATRITLVVDGKVVGSVAHPSVVAEESAVGLLAAGTGSSPLARYDDLIVSP